MKSIWNYIKPYRLTILGIVCLIGFQAFCNLMIPNMMSQIVNVGIQDYSQQILSATDEAVKVVLQQEQMAYILKTGGLMLLLALFTALVAISVHFFNARVGTGIARDIRKGIFTKIESFSAQEFDQFSTASLITRTTNDVQQVQMLFSMGIRIVIFAPLMGIGGIFMAVTKAPSMTWISALSVLVVIGMMIVVFSLAMPRFKKIQTLVDRLNLVARESLSGLMVIRAFSTQAYEENRFDQANLEYKSNNLFVNRIMSVMGPTMGLVQSLTPVLIVWIAASKIAASTMLVGDMIAFIQYSINIMQSFMMISMIFVMIPRAMVSIKRIAQVLDTTVVITEKANPTVLENKPCTISFHDVSFTYPTAEESLLEHISFTVKSGETTAIIGPTGCGKSTLVSLIPRLYEVTEGSITINGVDIRELSFENLRGLMGYVPQKSMLFSGNIRSNLLVGKEHANQAEVDKAVEIAQAQGFISEKEDGLDTSISQGGTNVSGGQRQRLSIARALVKGSPIYIFDDSFSALDFKTDAQLRGALKSQVSDATTIIVGQRVASIMNADQIIVMDKGRITGKGTHKELLKTCQEYREIVESQLSKEEM